MLRCTALFISLLSACSVAPLCSANAQAIFINRNFEGASLGTVEKQDDTTFRLHVAGQYDERGRNRQASWFYFRMENVKGRALVRRQIPCQDVRCL